MEEEKSLKIGSFNVKNIETNTVYVNEILKTCDILAIQEHWLFNFQLQDIEKMFTSHSAFSKAVDDDNPLPPTQKPRGYGGVAILFRKEMDLTVKKLPSGGNRIVAVEIQTTPPLCICCVYMPSRNSKNSSSDNYQLFLDQLEELVTTYSSTHAVFILGDLNASLIHRKGNLQDSLLVKFVESNSLFYQQSGKETFFHPNKSDKAEIDYILYNKSGNDLIQDVSVAREIALNTSDHVPVTGVLNVTTKDVPRQHLQITCKPKWDKCDRAVYRRAVRKNLQSFDTFLPTLTNETDILQPLSHLNTVLKQATFSSIPKFQSEISIKKIRNRPWTKQIHDAVRLCRLRWWEWKKSGSPSDPNAETTLNTKLAKKSLRKEQRREAARRRTEKAEEIMNSNNDTKMFYKLINNQRKTMNPQLQSLVVNGKECATPEEIRNGWAEHFQILATPQENPNFDEEYKLMVDLDVEVIELLCREEESPISPVAQVEVTSALKKLNNNKAADIMGLTSEHFKLAGMELTEFLTSFLNYIISNKSVSVVLKEGILSPVYKKGDPSNPGNYRGITVTPVLLKILEHILNARHNRIYQDTQSRLQKGFTSGCSSLNAAFILSECILEAASCKQDLYLTTLDTQKAFDVVDQNSLLRKLYLDGIQGDDWLLLKDLYSDCSSRVKWAGELSHPINIRQGVRQGGVLSANHYKRYNNPLLLQLENRYSGLEIGTISLPHITVADDLALLARSKLDMQVMVWDTENSAGRERYCIHPTKSHLLCYYHGRKSDSESEILLNGTCVDITDSAVHLGVVRSISEKADIDGKLSLGRRTAYSLMGAGFHGGSGLKAAQNGHIWSVFVIPRLLYGLEVQLLKCKDIENLERFQRQCLKQIQGLPDKTSNSACLALLGILPVECILHKNLLNLFINMVRNENSVEYEIIQRQLAIKEPHHKSLLTHIRSILDRYGLPSIFTLLRTPPSKAEWKGLLDHGVHEAVETQWKSDIQSKSSTKYLNPNVLKVGSCHHIWHTVRNSVHDSIRAQLKCKLLTGTYILQANRAAFNQHAVNPTCKLCSEGPETRQHFLTECSFLTAERQSYIQRLTTLCIFTDAQIQQLNEPVILTQLTLDASIVINIENLSEDQLGSLELYTREYIYRIHRKRIAALRQLSDNR